MEAEAKTWPEWVDALGNTYGPGDIVAVSTINGKSPQLVIARVEKLNRINSSGKLITKRKYFDHPEPIQKTVERKRWIVNPTCGHEISRWTGNCNMPPGHVGDHHNNVSWRSGYYEKYEHTFTERGEYREVPSCTIQATPLVDARGFGRYGKDKETGANRKVTYSIPENILLIERADESDTD